MQNKVLFFCSFFSFIQLFAQNPNIDSLYRKLQQKNLHDTSIINIWNELAYELRYIKQESSFSIAQKNLQKAQQINYIKGIADADYVIGIYYSNKSEYIKAIKNYFKSLDLYQKIKNKKGVARVYNNIAIVYYYQKDYKRAEVFLNNSLEINRLYQNYVEIARCHNNLGRLYFDQQQYQKALEYYRKSIDLVEKYQLKGDFAIYFCNIAESLFKLKQYEEALIDAQKAMNLAIKNENPRMQIRANIIIAAINMDKKNLEEAEKLISKALNEIQNHKYPEEELLGLEYAYQLFELKNDYKNAHIFHEKYVALKDSLTSVTNLKTILQKDYEYNEKIKEELRKNERESEFWTRILLFSALGFLLGLLFFAYRAFYIKSKGYQIISKQKNEIENKNQEIERQQIELLSLNEEILAQKDNLEVTLRKLSQATEDLEKNITYASKIQALILPKQEEINDFFKNSFVLFKPKEVVSGDFYWFSKIDNEKAIFVCSDCTGHGVSGAFMTMLGSALLHEIVNERCIISPSDILHELNDSIYKILKQYRGTNYDGMDVSICLFERNIKENKAIITFAGSKSYMYYFENNQLNIIKGDKMRIGGVSPTFHFENKVFETKLQNTKFYFATDGYTDQNNEKREKIGTHNLQKILENIANEDFRIQKQTLIAYLAEHQGREPQRDDISVICLQLN